MESPAAVRVDKWLWAARLYKTRTLAADACNAGKVRIQNQPIKPSRSVRVGEVLTAVTGDITRTVKVLGLVEKRVGAKLVDDLLEDLTPASEYEKPRNPTFAPFIFRPKGAGRPTKRDRRKIDNFNE
ncbi:MAG: RNA-binding S4 domain-containing protein [Verrucomicrobia bacterium]|nr:RNA-binding S4 domain-containing protein [Verrucomicrobiota bacterium]